MALDTKLYQGKDVFERMNYLYQASHFVASKNKVAASCYGNVMLGCAKKAVLRMEQDLKRTLCKCCQTPLVPGETARVRLESRPVKAVKWTCLTCKSVRKFPTKKGYKLWTHQTEALVKLFKYVPKPKVIDSSEINSNQNFLPNDATSSTHREKPIQDSANENVENILRRE